MKTMRVVWSVVASLAWVATVSGQAMFSTSSSNWGAGGTGTFSGTATGGALLANGTTPNSIYYVAGTPDANTAYFALVNNPTPTNVASDFNVNSTMAAGTAITVTFTGIAVRPDYVAYTGGALTAYSYNAAAGTLTLAANLVDPVASASDPTSTTLRSTFGVLIKSGTALNFSGTVFQTGMYFNDVAPLATYAGTNYVAGVNASGINGQTASFYAYLPVGFLGTYGITQPDDARAVVQKTGGVTPIVLSNLSVDIYGPGVPTFSTQSTPWTYVGPSTFDFNGDGVADDFIVATYTNSSWSDANIGLVAAVPEPATYVTLFGIFALLTALRRRALNNAPMR